MRFEQLNKYYIKEGGGVSGTKEISGRLDFFDSAYFSFCREVNSIVSSDSENKYFNSFSAFSVSSESSSSEKSSMPFVTEESKFNFELINIIEFLKVIIPIKNRIVKIRFTLINFIQNQIYKNIYTLAKYRSVLKIFFLAFVALNFACNEPLKKETNYLSEFNILNKYVAAEDSSVAFIEKNVLENALKPKVNYGLDSLCGILSGTIFLSGNTNSTKLINANKQLIDSLFNSVKRKRINKISNWAKGEIPQSSIVFYPFSGPDLLNVVALFPKADTYYLLALEPLGKLPKVNINDSSQISGYFNCLTQSLEDIFKKSYFITRRMNEHLACDNLQGVLPLLSFFIKRSDMEIVSIDKVKIDSLGNEQVFKLDSVIGFKRPIGVKIKVLDAEKNLKTIYYYSCDLSNATFHDRVPFYKYISGNIEDCNSYIKAASYLMHYNSFTNIRDLILAKSKMLVQDDTGIPVRHIISDKWQCTLYGKYVKPVKDFANVEQKDLYLLYKLDSSDVKPIPFDLGYHWGTKENNLMRCIKK